MTEKQLDFFDKVATPDFNTATAEKQLDFFDKVATPDFNTATVEVWQNKGDGTWIAVIDKWWYARRKNKQAAINAARRDMERELYKTW